MPVQCICNDEMRCPFGLNRQTQGFGVCKITRT
ncbi:hypothetical protein Q604_UNBC07443G0002, partial [human gut metagenome]